MRKNVSRRDLERLSAYLDNQLSARERANLEDGLRAKDELRAALDDLRWTRAMVRRMPRARTPRNLTLNAEMAGSIRTVKPGLRLYPVFRLASALASVMLVIILAGDLLSGSFPNQGFQRAESPADQVTAVQVEAEIVVEQPAAAMEALAELAESEDDTTAKVQAPAAEEPMPALEADSPTTQSLTTGVAGGGYPLPTGPSAPMQTEVAIETDTSQLLLTPTAPSEPIATLHPSSPQMAEPIWGVPANVWRVTEGILAVIALVAGSIAIYLRWMERF